MNGMIKVILELGLQNDTFISQRTSGFEELKRYVAELELSEVQQISGVA